jgi:small subunit ribosomal protein S16
MLTIRLQRVGKTKLSAYRFIISEKGRDTHGRYLENLGNFNPHDNKNGLVLKTERIKYWLEKGAQTSDTVHNIFVAQGLIQGKKKNTVKISKKRAEKIKKEGEAKKTA